RRAVEGSAAEAGLPGERAGAESERRKASGVVDGENRLRHVFDRASDRQREPLDVLDREPEVFGELRRRHAGAGTQGEVAGETGEMLTLLRVEHRINAGALLGH